MDRVSFKDIWSNKRYRSLIILGIYFVFFVFVFIYINIQNAPKPVKVIDAMSYYESMDNYNFAIDLVDKSDDSNINIVGKCYDGKEFFDIDGSSYYVVSDKVYDSNYDVSDVKLNYLNPSYILGIIDISTKVSETDNMVDNYKETTYSVKKDDYVKFYDLDYFNDQDEVILSIRKKDNKVIGVSIDGLFYKVDINYSGFGTVSDFVLPSRE